MAVSQTKEVVPLSLTSEGLRALLCAASHAPSHGDRHNGPLGTRGGRTAGRRLRFAFSVLISTFCLHIMTAAK
jgi:hypothetical protein